MRFILSILLAILCSITSLFGQDSTKVVSEEMPSLSSDVKSMFKKKTSKKLDDEPNLKWGKVEEEYLKMKMYENDKAANEVLLLSYSKIDFAFHKETYGMLYEYHFRIKIMDKSKYEGGEIELLSTFYDEITTIKAQTINWNEDGIERVKVKEILTDEQGENRTLFRFSFPEIKDGSVLEYKYTIFARNRYILEPKYFQSSYPVVWSEFRLVEMDELDYKKVLLGNREFFYKSEENVEANGIHNGATEYRYVMKNLPRVPHEAYSASIDNSLARMIVQLHSYNFDSKKYVYKDWDDYTDIYTKDVEAIAGTKNTKYTKKFLKALKPVVAGKASEKDKMIAIYNYVRDNINWSTDYTIYINTNLKDAFKNKYGGSADINLLLMAGLQEYGITVNPVLLNPRGNGRSYKEYPFVKLLNHVMLKVELENRETYFLDAIYKDIPYNLNPYPNLNHEAFLIKNGQGKWIEMSAEPSIKAVQVDLEIAKDGNLKGTFEYTRDFYRGFETRQEIVRDGKEKYQQSYFNSIYSDVKVSNMTFENEKIYDKPITERMDFESSSVIQVAGDLMYFTLLMNLGMSETMFREPKRKTPIDLPYPYIDDYTFNIKIPDGYKVDEMPEAVDLKLPNNDAVFKLTIAENNGVLIYNARVEMNQLHYEVAEYQMIKDFTDKIVEIQTTQIVLKKE